MSTKTNPSVHRLGKDGPEIPPMGFGLMTLTGAHGGRSSNEEQFQILDRAYELGNTFWDTSDIYMDNLEILAEWFRRTGKRDEIFLASKFGLVMEDNFTLKGFNSSAEHCKKICDESLKRAGVDYFDLYYVHHINPETPIEDTMRAMVDLKAEGKIKHIGLCSASSSTLRRASKITQVAAVQAEYSAFVLDLEGERSTNLLNTCRELGVAVVCFGPIGRGLLTGTVTGNDSVSGAGDIRSAWVPRFKQENLDKNLRVVSQFKALADKKGCSPTQLALAWLLKQGDDIFPIPGTKRVKYLEANWESLNIRLTDAEEAEVRQLVAASDLAGFETHPSAYVDTKEEF